MSAPAITILDLRIVECVLEMGSGYVLDFSNRTFAAFFQDYGVDIDDQRYFAEGSSKASRLRFFLRHSQPLLAGRVLDALLQHRLTAKPQGIRADDLRAYRGLVQRLGAPSTDSTSDVRGAATANGEAALLRMVFNPELFTKLPVDGAMAQALIDRMLEAQRCVDAKASLAAVILCGSVLEGMCLGYGSIHLERVNRGYAARFGRPAKSLPEWRLAEWIDVLVDLGDLSPNIAKFGHGLRDFRNYVHPAEQLAHHFSPDQRTARIAFQVVVAAADDLIQATATSSREGTA